jgi:hypothetical protein
MTGGEIKIASIYEMEQMLSFVGNVFIFGFDQVLTYQGV